MSGNYKYNNSIVNYITGISRLKDLLENTKYENHSTEETFYAVIYCHIVSIMDAYIGDIIRYGVCQKEGTSARKYEKESFFNPEKASRALKDVYDINFTFDDSLLVATEKRNIIIHRNGYLQDGRKCRILLNDVKSLIRTIQKTVSELHEAVVEAQAKLIV